MDGKKRTAAYAYAISDGPTGRLWWAPGEAIPPQHSVVRLATSDEINLMQRIERHRNPPLKWGDKIKDMIAND